MVNKKTFLYLSMFSKSINKRVISSNNDVWKKVIVEDGYYLLNRRLLNL